MIRRVMAGGDTVFLPPPSAVVVLVKSALGESPARPELQWLSGGDEAEAWK